jgi:UbiD family decarboxylase
MKGASMQPYDDLRSFVSDLDAAGEIVKVDIELAPEFEIPAALRYLDRRDDRTILFSRVKGYTLPVIGNLFQNYRNIAAALGIKDSRAVLDEYRKKSGTRINAEMQKFGPVKEVILKEGIDILQAMPQDLISALL